jgi:hypothetical protein
MYEIPTSIEIDGRQFHIRNNGDYRVILDCFQALEDVELQPTERILASLIIFYEDFNTIEDIYEVNIEKAVSEMYNFFNCGSDNFGTSSKYKLIDWEGDAQLICSAVNKVAGTEVRSVPYIHWWTFMGYYTAIGDSPISTIIHIRDKIMSNKKLEKYEREFRMKNPQYFTWNSKRVDDAEADKLMRELWNNNSGG